MGRVRRSRLRRREYWAA